MLSLRLISSRQFGYHCYRSLLHTRPGSIMEASTSHETQHKSTILDPQLRKKDISPSTSLRPRKVASPSTAYISERLRNIASLSSNNSEIDDLSQSVKRVTLSDTKLSSRAKPASNETEHHSRQSTPQKGERRGQRIYGDYSKKAMADKESRTQPSKASGGIPDPTPAYLSLSALPYHAIPSPQHLLVVIDLNGTLLYRPNRKNPTKFVARPNTLRFLRYCIDTFTVVIWSSARPDNVRNMCDAILKSDMRSKVAAIWGREKFNFTPTDYNLRVQCYKRMTTLWNDEAIKRSHPEYERGGCWDQTNTVLVDDSINKGRSEPYNLIEIPEFFGDDKEKGHILPQVHDYLNSLAMHSNVSSYMRSHPFSTTQEIIAQQIQPQPELVKPRKLNPDVIAID